MQRLGRLLKNGYLELFAGSWHEVRVDRIYQAMDTSTNDRNVVLFGRRLRGIGRIEHFSCGRKVSNETNDRSAALSYSR